MHNGIKFVQHYPCSILKGRLYLGDANHASQHYVVKNMRISHIVNVTDCCENAFDNDDENINYCTIKVTDTTDEYLINYFPQFYCFLEDAYNSNLRLDYDVPDETVALKVHAYDFKQKHETQSYKKKVD